VGEVERLLSAYLERYPDEEPEEAPRRAALVALARQYDAYPSRPTFLVLREELRWLRRRREWDEDDVDF
jgi:hypothetical protein